MKKRLILICLLISIFALSLFAACDKTTYTVTFDTDGGSAIEAQTVTAGQYATKPSDPVKSGYTFDGWYTSDGAKWNFDTDAVNSDITLYARYTQNSPGDDDPIDGEDTYYTVSFETNGGSSIADVTVKAGDTLSKPTNPTKNGYVFNDWYTDQTLKSAYDFSKPVNSSFTLYAAWANATDMLMTVDYGQYAPTVEKYYKANSDFSFGEYLIQSGEYVSLSFVDEDGTEYLLGQTYTFAEPHTFTAVFEKSDFILSWDYANSGLQIDGLTDSGKAIANMVVPSAIHSATVTAIGDKAFANTSITALTLPDSIVIVGDAILAGCASLKTLSLPFVGDKISTEYGNTSVMGWYFGTEDYAGSTPTTVYYSADGTAASPKSGVAITAYYPSSFDTLEIRGGTAHCYVAQYMPVNHLVLGNVDYVMPYAFYHSTLKSVSFEDNTVKEIGSFAFTATQIENLVLPDGLEYIGRDVFGNNNALKSATMTDSVIGMDGEVFAQCTSLVTVRLSEILPGISYNTFIGCSSLKEVNIPHAAEYIDSQAFEGAGITQIDIPSTVTAIYGRAFCYSKLTSITLPAGLNYLGSYSFWYCDEMTSVEFLGNNLSYIDAYVFANTEKLTHFTIPSSVNTIYSYAFYRSGLQDIYIPDTVDTIYSYAFSYCSDLMSVTFGSNPQITRFADGIFNQCTSLSEIEIPSSVKTLGTNVFTNCSSLNLLIIPASVTTIEGACFVGCTYIRMYSPLSSAPSGWNANWNTSELPITFVGRDIRSSGKFLYSVEDSQARILAHIYGDSEVVVPGTLGGYPVVEIGTSAFEYDYDMTSLVIEEGVENISEHAFKDCRNLISATLPEGLISIADEAFYCCFDLAQINLPTTLKTIGSKAFQACSNVIFYTTLKSSQRPSGWDTYNALSGKTIVWELDMSEISVYGVLNYTEIDGHIKILQVLVENIEGIIVIPSEINGLPVTEIGDQAFYNVTAYAIYIPSSVTTFGSKCFSSNKLNFAFESSSKPAGFDANCFANGSDQYNNATIRYGCTVPTMDEATGIYYFTSDGKAIIVGLEEGHLSVVIPTTLGDCEVDTIGTGVFYNNKSFVSIIIPSTIKNIGRWAFYNTNNALKIYCNVDDMSAFNANWNQGASGVFYYNVDVKYTDEFEYIVKDGNVIITHYIGSGKTVTIPAKIDGLVVTTIGDRAFANDPTEIISPSAGLYAVYFEEGSQLTTIEYRAFYNCYNLCKIYVIPASVTSFGSQAFYVYTPRDRDSAHRLWFGFANSASAGTFSTYINGTYSADALDFYTEEVGKEFIAFLDSYDPWGVFGD